MMAEAAPKEAEKTEGPPAEGDAAAEASSGMSKKKKMLIFGGAGAALLLLIAGVAVVFLMGGNKDEKAAEGHAAEAAAAVAVYDVPPLNVNLLSEGDAPHFLKAKFALEMANPADVKAMEAFQARIQDDWQNFLRQMRMDDFQGSTALQRLKEALLLRASQVVAPLVVKNVLIRELLVQ